MFRKENLFVFAIIGVAVLYGLFSLIIFFTRGRLKRMVKQKIALGIMLITFVGIFNGCSLDTLQVESGKSSSRLPSNGEVLAADSSVLPSPTGTLTLTPTPMCYTPAPTITPTPTTQPPTPMCYTPTPPPTPTPTVTVTSTPTPMCYTQAPTMTPTPTAMVTSTPTPMCYTQAPTVTPTPTFTPTVTSTPTSVPTPTCYTQAPTLSPTPTFSPTVTPTPTFTGSSCTVPVAISGRFVKDGAGEFCWTNASVLQYINSWNLDLLEINGKVFTNMYVAAASLPAKINGLYYIHYKGRFPWSHVEIN